MRINHNIWKEVSLIKIGNSFTKKVSPVALPAVGQVLPSDVSVAVASGHRTFDAVLPGCCEFSDGLLVRGFASLGSPGTARQRAVRCIVPCDMTRAITARSRTPEQQQESRLGKGYKTVKRRS